MVLLARRVEELRDGASLQLHGGYGYMTGMSHLNISSEMPSRWVNYGGYIKQSWRKRFIGRGIDWSIFAWPRKQQKKKGDPGENVLVSV
jgi:hypothetical protein